MMRISPWTRESYRRIVLAMFAIHLAAVLLTLILPGFVAHAGGVFYADGILARSAAKLAALKRFEESKQSLHDAVIRFDGELARSFESEGLTRRTLKQLDLRREAQSRLAGMRHELAAVGFFLNPQMLVWPAVYTCLGWLVFVFGPPRSLRPSNGPPWESASRVALVAVLVYLAYEWPLWVRNFAELGSRRVFAYPNWDVHPPSFLLQEAVIAGFCLLLAWSWSQWLDHLEAVRRKLTRERVSAELLLGRRYQARLANTFTHWVLSSIILGLAFFPFTTFYWRLVHGFGDKRYVLPAILAHVLWGISWTVLSLPLIATWAQWNRDRNQVVQALVARMPKPAWWPMVGEREKPPREVVLKPAEAAAESVKTCELVVAHLLRLQPISLTSLVVANVGAVVSFGLPLLQLFSR